MRVNGFWLLRLMHQENASNMKPQAKHQEKVECRISVLNVSWAFESQESRRPKRASGIQDTSFLYMFLPSSFNIPWFPCCAIMTKKVSKSWDTINRTHISCRISWIQCTIYMTQPQTQNPKSSKWSKSWNRAIIHNWGNYNEISAEQQAIRAECGQLTIVTLL